MQASESRGIHRRGRFIAVISIVLTLDGAARAQSPTELPTVLTQSGITEKNRGQLKVGCKIIETAMEMQPSWASSYHRAECRTKLGRLGRGALDLMRLSATAAKEAERATNPTDRAFYLEWREKIEGLLQKLRDEIDALPRLSIHLSQPLQAIPGVKVELDDLLLDKETTTYNVPVDNGRHEVFVRIPGHDTQVKTVLMNGASEQLTFDVASGAAVPPTASSPQLPTPNVTALLLQPLIPQNPPPSALPRNIGIGIGLSVGIIGLAAGTGIGVGFLTSRHRYYEDCQRISDCDRDGTRVMRLGELLAWEAGAFAAGGVGFVIAGLLYLTSPQTSASSPTIQVAPFFGPKASGLSVTGYY